VKVTYSGNAYDIKQKCKVHAGCRSTALGMMWWQIRKNKVQTGKHIKHENHTWPNTEDTATTALLYDISVGLLHFVSKKTSPTFLIVTSRKVTRF